MVAKCMFDTFFLYQKMIQMNITDSQTSKARLMVAKVEGRVRL